jgi:CRP-like cAMP-binding protein
VGKPAKNAFDPKAFLAKVGAGKTILKFERSQHVFTQGDVADAVFYIQKGRVKLTVLSEQVRKRSSGFWNRANSSARGASMAIHCVSRPQRRWKNA